MLMLLVVLSQAAALRYPSKLNYSVVAAGAKLARASAVSPAAGKALIDFFK
jgi:hypothetical protein